MTTNPLRHALVALHTALGTWHTYPYGVPYCPTCDRLYASWPGCPGRGRPACDGRLLAELVALLGQPAGMSVERVGDPVSSACPARSSRPCGLARAATS
jgi:hypothetical protein